MMDTWGPVCLTGGFAWAGTPLKCEEREIVVAKVRFHCTRRRARLSCPLLGWGGRRRPPGHALSIRHLYHQHFGVRDYRLQPGISGWARAGESRMEVFYSGGIRGRVQHIFDIRVGDILADAKWRVSDSRVICCPEPGSRPGGCVVRCDGREAAVMRMASRSQRSGSRSESPGFRVRSRGC